MNILIRQAQECDKNAYLDFAVKLCRFNRENHDLKCKYDDFSAALEAIRRNAEATFDEIGEDTLLLIAEMDSKPAGYALGRIFQQEPNADNGTGRMGLFDELFVDESARGQGLGQMLMDEVMDWFREKGISRVKLHAYSWNSNARSMYEKNGFEEYVVSYEKFI